MSFTVPAIEAPLSSPISVGVNVQNVSDLFSAPLRILYNPNIIRLTGAQAGSLMGADGQVEFTQQIANEAGEATIIVSRKPGAGGVRGSGTVLNLNFQAVGRGATAVTVEPSLRNTQLQPIAAGSPSLSVTVQ